MDKIVITLAVKEDLEKIHSLLEERCIWFNEKKIKQWSLNYPNRYNIDYFKEQMITNKLFVAKINNDIVGTMLLKDTDPKYWDDQTNSYYIHHLATKINIKDLGKKLLDYAIVECEKNDKKYLRLDCVSNNEWLNNYYKNFGFEYFGKKQLKYSIENLYQLKIQKKI